DTYHKVARAICTPSDFREVTEDYLLRASAEGVIYCELSVSPQHGLDEGISVGCLIDAIADGIEAAHSRTGIEARIVLTCVRHRGPEAAECIAREIAAISHRLVVGFGMSGNEATFRPADFAR